MAAASGCSLDRSRLAASGRMIGLRHAWRRHDRDDLRLALGQRAGLVHDQRVDLLHALQRLGRFDQHAGAGALADADHDRTSASPSPSAQGQAMMSTETAAISP